VRKVRRFLQALCSPKQHMRQANNLCVLIKLEKRGVKVLDFVSHIRLHDSFRSFITSSGNRREKNVPTWQYRSQKNSRVPRSDAHQKWLNGPQTTKSKRAQALIRLNPDARSLRKTTEYVALQITEGSTRQGRDTAPLTSTSEC
jgi:hypothetical protein